MIDEFSSRELHEAANTVESRSECDDLMETADRMLHKEIAKWQLWEYEQFDEYRKTLEEKANNYLRRHPDQLQQVKRDTQDLWNAKRKEIDGKVNAGIEYHKSLYKTWISAILSHCDGDKAIR